MARQTIDSTLMSAIVTSLVSSLGFGMLVILAGFYLLNLGHRETRLERATVATLCFIMFARTGLDISGAVRATSGRFADVHYQIVPKSLFESVVSPLLGVISIGICHIFISQRILSFAGSVKTSHAYLRTAVQWAAIVGVTGAFALGITSIALIWKTAVARETLAVKLSGVRIYTVLSAIYSVVCCCLDIFLAWVVSFEVRKSKSRSDTNADRVLVSLLRNTICSTILTGVCQILKTVFLFIGQTGWAGTTFSIASTSYSVFLLLSISLPRSAGDKHAKASNPIGTPGLDISSINQFFSSHSATQHPTTTTAASHPGHSSDEKLHGASWDAEADDGTDLEMGLGEMLASPLPISTFSSPSASPHHSSSSPHVRIRMPPRNRSFLGTTTAPPTNNPPYSPSSPVTSFNLDELPIVHSSSISRQSSLVRGGAEKGSRNRKRGPISMEPGAEEMDEGMMTPRSTGELNIQYILSGLMVQSIKQPTTSSSRRLL